MIQKGGENKTMDYLTMALTILISAIINVAVTIALFKLIVMKLGLQKYLRFASQRAAELGTLSGKAKQGRIQAVKNKGTQEKLLNGVIESLPMGGAIKQVMERQGLSGSDVFEALQDENFIKGVMFLYKTFGGIANKISGKLSGKEESGNSDQSPPMY